MVEALLSGMQGLTHESLTHESYEKLTNGVTKLRSERFDQDLAVLRKL
jgi:hypothetical protein